MLLPSYPKIYNLGHPWISTLFQEEVTVEEKVDGSQFSFGVIAGELVCRSKGVQLDLDNVDKLFAPAVHTARTIQPLLRNGWVYRGEALAKPKHNTLAYDRVPQGNIALYDVMRAHEAYVSRAELEGEAFVLGLEVVPLVFQGMFSGDPEQLIDRVSFLGGAKIEGIVFKSRTQFGRDGKPMLGKYVRPDFRELNDKNWKLTNPGPTDIRQALAAKYCTKARWHKAVQHLAERGELQNAPQDIGNLMKEVHADLDGECKQEIMEDLWNWASKEFKRAACKGLPEWYKLELAKASE